MRSMVLQTKNKVTFGEQVSACEKKKKKTFEKELPIFMY